MDASSIINGALTGTVGLVTGLRYRAVPPTTCAGAKLLKCNKKDIRRLRREYTKLGIDRRISAQLGEIERLVDSTAQVGKHTREMLYAIVRITKPSIVIETGVANGASSWVFLAALERNGGNGRLFSIEYPPGRRKENVPKDKEYGWLVPAELRGRWSLIMEDAKIALPRLMEELGGFDIFMHDSLHTADHMDFEIRVALKYSQYADIIIVDDFQRHESIKQFLFGLWDSFSSQVVVSNTLYMRK